MRLRIFKRDVPKAIESLEIDKSRMVDNTDHQQTFSPDIKSNQKKLINDPKDI